MSLFACPAVLVTAAVILLPANQHTGGARACPPCEAREARVLLNNQTGDEILVYVDGVFAGRSQPYAKDEICVPANRKVEVLGRCMCDAWGPYTVVTAAGKSTTVRFTEQERAFKRPGRLN